MQDRKALQAGTSHFLGQNFAKAQEIQFQDDAGRREFCWTTSWGVSTRLIGGAIMTHADDDGMVCPPMVAPAHVVVQPVLHRPETAAEVRGFCDKLVADLRRRHYGGRAVEVELDARDIRGGDKTWQWVKRGIPVRVEVGPRDVASGSVFVGRRDKGVKEKQSIPVGAFVEGIESMLAEIQQGLLDRARAFRREHVRVIDSKDDFYDFFRAPGGAGDDAAPTPIHGGFALAHFGGDPALEERIKSDLAVTVRCIPLDGQGLCADEGTPGTCPFTGRSSPRRVVWAKSY